MTDLKPTHMSRVFVFLYGNRERDIERLWRDPLMSPHLPPFLPSLLLKSPFEVFSGEEMLFANKIGLRNEGWALQRGASLNGDSLHLWFCHFTSVRSVPLHLSLGIDLLFQPEQEKTHLKQILSDITELDKDGSCASRMCWVIESQAEILYNLKKA